MPIPFPHDISVDLHMHSTASDGALSPEDLVRYAHANGVQMMALTDHDTIAGQHAARETAQELGIRYVSGVEISVTWGGETIHVVGLNFDPSSPGLHGLLAGIQQGRQERAVSMARGLIDHGLPDVLEEARSYAKNPEMIGRTHFARAMVARGICSDVGEVFQRYLVPGKPGYAPHEWTSLTRAVTEIRQAGGVAVIAHPARYRLSATGHWALIDEFKTLGGSALEIVTGSHTEQEARRFQRVAVDHGLSASLGSDFHAVGESRYDAGAVPRLPDASRPIWLDWAH